MGNKCGGGKYILLKKINYNKVFEYWWICIC